MPFPAILSRQRAADHLPQRRKGVFAVKAHVNSSCIGCGLCESTCPEVFHIGDSGLAEAIADDVPAEVESSAKEARDGCPVDALDLTAD